MSLDKLVSILKKADRIAILPHVSADGDALGSSLALAIILDKLGKSVRVYLEEDIPTRYHFLPGDKLSGVYTGEHEPAEVVVALDTGDRERLGRRVAVLDAGKTTINLDHHKTNTLFAGENLVNTNASSAGEMVYQLIELMGAALTQETAVCLYVAIATDTGGFRYSNTTGLTHRIAGDLVNRGVDVAEMSRILFDTTSYPKTRLMGLAIQALELLEEKRVAFLTVTEDMFVQAGALDEDSDGIVNLGRNIEGVEVSVVFRQIASGEIKVNLRSKKYLDVAVIARKYGGGGHARAAGFTARENLTDLKRKILDDIKSGL